MPKILKLTRLGNPLLRKVAKRLTSKDIQSNTIQNLIADIRHTLAKNEYGVGLAAPQVGKSMALSVVGIKPTPNRPELKPFETVIINPEIIKTFGKPALEWEGCASCGTGDDLLFAKVPRYKKVTLRWLDETGARRQERLDGVVAHVAQHETDHLNGVMFLDKVEDPSSYMMADEYRTRVVRKTKKK